MLQIWEMFDGGGPTHGIFRYGGANPVAIKKRIRRCVYLKKTFIFRKGYQDIKTISLD